MSPGTHGQLERAMCMAHSGEGAPHGEGTGRKASRFSVQVSTQDTRKSSHDHSFSHSIASHHIYKSSRLHLPGRNFTNVNKNIKSSSLKWLKVLSELAGIIKVCPIGVLLPVRPLASANHHPLDRRKRSPNSKLHLTTSSIRSNKSPPLASSSTFPLTGSNSSGIAKRMVSAAAQAPSGPP